MKKLSVNTRFNLVGLGFLLWLLAIVLSALSSCNPVKKVLSDPDKFNQVAAEVVKRGYCINDTITVMHGDTTMSVDTSYENIAVTDSIIPMGGGWIFLPPWKVDTSLPKPSVTAKPISSSANNMRMIITKTVRIRDTITNNIRDKKIEEVFKTERDQLQGQLTESKQALKEMKVARNKWRLWCFVLIGVLGLATFLGIKRII